MAVHASLTVCLPGGAVSDCPAYEAGECNSTVFARAAVSDSHPSRGRECGGCRLQVHHTLQNTENRGKKVANPGFYAEVRENFIKFQVFVGNALMHSTNRNAEDSVPYDGVCRGRCPHRPLQCFSNAVIPTKRSAWRDLRRIGYICTRIGAKILRLPSVAKQ